MDILQHLFGFQVTLERVSLNFHWAIFIPLVFLHFKMIKSCISRIGKKNHE
jgi:hypothetical protein